MAPQMTMRAFMPAGEHGVEDLAADVVEVDVHALGAMFSSGPRGVAGLVVDAGVEAQLLDHPVALGLAAGNADHAAAQELGDLADRLPTAPAAPDTTTVSPAFGWPDSIRPK
jgi:hypothetical protein